MMTSFFRVSVHFLDPLFHGRRDGGAPEWPPSPLRVFQAFVAACANHGNERKRIERAAPALRWLEQLPAPDIVAPPGQQGAAYYLSVPNNAMDIVGRAWSRGNYSNSGDANPATHRTMKKIRPTRIADDATAHFLWPITDNTPEVADHLKVLSAAARAITHLGWGIDMVAANASIIPAEEAAKVPGEHWRPTDASGTVSYPIPSQGTFAALARRHTAFLERFASDANRPTTAPSLAAGFDFLMKAYRRDTDPAPRPFAAFSILRPDGGGFRPFDAARRATVVAGMVRHALAQVAKIQRPLGWSDDGIATIVLGHAVKGGPARLTPDAKRFAYLPLPSIERRERNGSRRSSHVGMIRRVIVAGRPGMAEEIAWVRRALSGAELIDERTGEVKALLSLIPSNDRNVRRYVKPASAWATVTPVVIPGYDDGRAAKTERLLRKALEQAGFSTELVRHAHLEWRGGGFLPGVDLACRYRRPRNASEAPVRHVKIYWRDQQGNPTAVPGPIAVGSGRFRGLGLFVPAES